MKQNKMRANSLLLAKKWMRLSYQEADIMLIESEESAQHSMELFDCLVACQTHPEGEPLLNISSELAQESHLSIPLYVMDSTDESTPSKTVLHEQLQPTHLKQILISERVTVTADKRKKGCNCKNNKCSKRYCQCFRGGLVCIEGLCSCIDCHNVKPTKHHEKTLTQYLKDVDTMRKGCNCKKSKCLKNYCQCHSSGRKCRQYCQCMDCNNTQTKAFLDNQQPKKYIKMCGLPEEDGLSHQ